VKHAWLVLLAMVPATMPGPAAAAPPIIAWTYVVQPGDTLAAVAARMGLSATALARANGIEPDARLAPGTVLKRPDPADMPTREKRPPRRTTVPARVAPTPRTMPPPRPVPRPVPSPQPAHGPEPGAPRMVWPTSGALVNRFGARVHGRADNGIDLAAFAGMTVRAAAAGQVIFAGTEPERFGQLIVIDHGNGWATAYAYLGKVAITTGAKVGKGQAIARIGTSGEAKQPMLHFELRHDNVPRDPVAALPTRL
jgi:lipoprotein NlpD